MSSEGFSSEGVVTLLVWAGALTFVWLRREEGSVGFAVGALGAAYFVRSLATFVWEGCLV